MYPILERRTMYLPLLKSAHHSFALFAVVLLAGCASSTPPLPTVQSVDLSRYYGTWYEIARLPNWFQSMCVSDTRADYRPDGENVSVVNQCRTADGKTEQASGIAKVVAGSQGAKLRVSFFRPFYGDYWILDLDPDYRWVLVGEPGRKYGWILARDKTLDAATLDRLLARAEVLGYDRQAFIRTPQTRATH
jgi:apolipoprotein D and lipocalin family protein